MTHLHHGLLLTTAALFSACTAASAAPPASDLGIAYGPDPAQVLDIYRPASQTGPLPAILIIHGGGWREGSRKDLAFAARAFADAGFVAVCIDYRLATPTSNKFPAQLDDAQRAVRYLRANAATLKIDPDKIGAFGHSAGGHLAALLGTEDTRDNSDKTLATFSSRVQAVVDTSGPTDFVSPHVAPVTQNAIALIAFAFGVPLELAQQAATNGPTPAQQLFTLASPALHVDKDTAPFLIVHGKNDALVPVEQAQRMADALKAAHKDGQLLILEGEGHVFTKQSDLEKWIAASTKFFKDKLK
jgi:acetyl esterase/lipase